MSTEFYRNSLEHILAELERIDILIRSQVQRVKKTKPVDAELQGLYISEHAADELITQPVGLPRWAADKDAEDLVSFSQLEETIARRKDESIKRGISLRLDEIEHLFQLTPFDRDTLLICLAPELDLRYERLYAYLQDDVTKKRPSVDLVLNMLCSSFETKLANRQRFTSSGPAINHRLLELVPDPAYPNPPLIAKFVKLDERIASYLLGSDELEEQLQDYAHCISPHTKFDELILPENLKQGLRLLASEDVIFYFQGPYGVGKQSAAEAICLERNLRLLVVDGSSLHQIDPNQFQIIAQLAIRGARLQKAALYWNDFDLLLTDENSLQRMALLHELEEQPVLSFLAGETTWEPADALLETGFVRLEFQKPTAAERVHLWSRFLEVDAAELTAIGNKFRFTGGQIRDAAATARNLARWRDPENGTVGTADLNAACRLHSNRKLAGLARKITPHYHWDDIILPAERLEQLREVCNSVKYRTLVYDEWGFGRKLALGKGLNVLFAGPSGTGKTMAAEIMAGELGLDLYKIDLSTIVSKYIGETEKNLARIFAEAETSNAILFFDEADALFGKRSEVRDAHDRYANIEIAYLLQKMDEYEGVVILATNLRKNMDESFVRRMHFTVEFPFPDEQDRLRIWSKIFPAETPRSTDLDLDFLARHFEITGGNIRNISLAAAFLAADNGAVVKMAHIVQATRREYQKMGKVILESEFGKDTLQVKRN